MKKTVECLCLIIFLSSVFVCHAIGHDDSFSMIFSSGKYVKFGKSHDLSAARTLTWYTRKVTNFLVTENYLFTSLRFYFPIFSIIERCNLSKSSQGDIIGMDESSCVEIDYVRPFKTITCLVEANGSLYYGDSDMLDWFGVGGRLWKCSLDKVEGCTEIFKFEKSITGIDYKYGQMFISVSEYLYMCSLNKTEEINCQKLYKSTVSISYMKVAFDEIWVSMEHVFRHCRLKRLYNKSSNFGCHFFSQTEDKHIKSIDATNEYVYVNFEKNFLPRIMEWKNWLFPSNFENFQMWRCNPRNINNCTDLIDQPIEMGPFIIVAKQNKTKKVEKINEYLEFQPTSTTIDYS